MYACGTYYSVGIAMAVGFGWFYLSRVGPKFVEICVLAINERGSLYCQLSKDSSTHRAPCNRDCHL